MKLRIKERELSAAIILLAVVVVIALGVLQYRWSNQVSEATSIRLADSLEMPMNRLFATLALCLMLLSPLACQKKDNPTAPAPASPPPTPSAST